MNVWVTRDEASGGPLGDALRVEGLTPVHARVIRRTPTGDAAREITTLGPDDWLVLTSAFAVQCVASEAATRPRCAVVGSGTADAARVAGLRVELVGTGTGEELFAELRERFDAGRLCLPRSSLAREPASWGAVVISSPVVYETTPVGFDRATADFVDIAAVTSPSAARAMGEVDVPRASIGMSTSDAIRATGFDVVVEASQPTFTTLARAIADHRSSRHHRA